MVGKPGGRDGGSDANVETDGGTVAAGSTATDATDRTGTDAVDAADVTSADATTTDATGSTTAGAAERADRLREETERLRRENDRLRERLATERSERERVVERYESLLAMAHERGDGRRGSGELVWSPWPGVGDGGGDGDGTAGRPGAAEASGEPTVTPPSRSLFERVLDRLR